MNIHINTLHGNTPICMRSARRPAPVPVRPVHQLNASTTAPGSVDDEPESAKTRTRRTRLFKPADSEGGAAAAAGSSHDNAVDSSRIPISEEFKRAFEDPSKQPSGAGKSWPAAGREQAAATSRQYRNSGSPDSGRGGSYPDRRTPRTASHSSNSRASAGSLWQGRGSARQRDSTPAEDRPPRNEEERQRWIAEAEQRARLAEEEERKRLIRKERSERIPTKPKRSQDPVIFQAIERALQGGWDKKATTEELRGARAAARKIARVGLYDRNKSLRAVRRKLLQNPKRADDPEVAALAANAARQIADAAAKSIQPSKEELYQEAAGVPRDFSRAKTLPEGEWDRLQKQYLAEVTQVKLGRKGVTTALVGQIQSVWRNAEVCKLRIHDDKSSRKMNLPRFNLVLKELEEATGTGVVIMASGSSIWLYRGVDWVPPPKAIAYKPPPQHELFTQEHTPRGSWKNIADISCYVVCSSEAAELTSPLSTSSSDARSSSSSTSAVDQMMVLLLPDQFPMADMPLMMQIADRVASKGAVVVMPDLLGPDASSTSSSLASKGRATAGVLAGYWRMNYWPLVKKRKLEYYDWYNKGPGSWVHQRPRFMKLLQDMQEQGMYSKDGAAAAAAAESGDAVSSSSSSGIKPLGILGLGWGSYIGMRAAGDDEFIAAGVQAVAAMSPVTFMKDMDIATALQLPVALLPAKYDPMEQMMLTIDLLQRPYAQRCIFKRYGKVKPGWAHWLPQWQDNRAMYQAAEQLLLSVAYLKRELLGIPDASIPPPLAKGEAATAVAAAAAAEQQQQGEEGSEGSSEDGEE